MTSRRYCLPFVAAAILLVHSLGNARAAEPSPLADAIVRGTTYLLAQQKADGSWADIPGFPGGVSSLCTLALLESGTPATDAKLTAAVATWSIWPSRTGFTPRLCKRWPWPASRNGIERFWSTTFAGWKRTSTRARQSRGLGDTASPAAWSTTRTPASRLARLAGGRTGRRRGRLGHLGGRLTIGSTRKTRTARGATRRDCSAPAA